MWIAVIWRDICRYTLFVQSLNIHWFSDRFSYQNSEFEQLFNMNRIDFYRLPEWRRNEMKRRVKLFWFGLWYTPKALIRLESHYNRLNRLNRQKWWIASTVPHKHCVHLLTHLADVSLIFRLNCDRLSTRHSDRCQTIVKQLSIVWFDSLHYTEYWYLRVLFISCCFSWNAFLVV